MLIGQHHLGQDAMWMRAGSGLKLAPGRVCADCSVGNVEAISSHPVRRWAQATQTGARSAVATCWRQPWQQVQVASMGMRNESRLMQITETGTPRPRQWELSTLDVEPQRRKR